MKTIKKEVLPCPEKIPGPQPVIFYLRKSGMLKAALTHDPSGLEISACYTTPEPKVRGILGIAKMVEAKRAFEIGTCAGATSCNLFLAGMHVETIDLQQPLDVTAGVFGTDSPDDFLPIWYDRMYIRAMRLPIVCHMGDTRIWNPGPLAKTFDLVFVDGDHSEAMARNDTELALKLLRPGGTIVWDDAALEGVEPVLKEFEVAHGEITLVECGAVGNGRDWPIAYWTEPS